MIKKLLFVCFTLCFLSISKAQTLPSNSEISIITSGPGKVLYEKFGHTAIRIKNNQFDRIYNYGFFAFNGTDFYIDFTKGYMKYKLVAYDFYYALKSAQQDGRWVKEQVLNLNEKQKQEVYSFLENNALRQNAAYLYDPYFNNCATKPRDIIQQTLGNSFSYDSTFVKKATSLRQLMNVEINPNTWGSFGINTALGSKLDKIATTEEYLYLPDYLYTALKHSSINNQAIVKQENVLLNFEELPNPADTPSPFLVFTIFLLVIVFITYRNIKNNKRTKWLDFSLFFITGTIGVLIVFLSFFTNHSTAPKNFNFLWAFAPNLVVAFYLLKGKLTKYLAYYILVLLIFIGVLPILWLSKVQLFTYPLIPLLLGLSIRYLYLYKAVGSRQ